jgi:para-nitrobenzyl esterase
MRESHGPSVFAYRLDWDEEPSVMGYDLSVALGAAHGLDNAFVFHNFINMTGTNIYRKDKIEGRDSLSRSMMSYWAEFAYTGNPGRGRSGNEALWTPWDNTGKESDKFIIFDTPEDGGIRMTTGAITMEDIKARLLADTSFTDQEEYCRMYVELFRNNPMWNQAEYESLGKKGCSSYDPKTFF